VKQKMQKFVFYTPFLATSGFACCCKLFAHTNETMNKDLREFTALLNSHGVEFIVVGGYCVYG